MAKDLKVKNIYKLGLDLSDIYKYIWPLTNQGNAYVGIVLGVQEVRFQQVRVLLGAGIVKVRGITSTDVMVIPVRVGGGSIERLDAGKSQPDISVGCRFQF